MDIVDITDRNEQVLLAAKLSNIRAAKTVYDRCRPNGRCHFCGAPLDNPEARWCDASCRDAWEKEVKKHGFVED